VIERLGRLMPPMSRARLGAAALIAACGLAATGQSASADTTAPIESVAGTTLPSNGYTNDNSTFVASSCSPSGTCVSVGDYKDDSGYFQGLILTTNAGVPAAGGAVESSVTIDNVESGLGSIGCWSGTSCVAVGDYIDTSNHQQALLVPVANGVPGTAQEIQPPGAPSPNPVDTADPVASLRGIGCHASGVCVAVGIYHDTSGGYDAFEVTINNGIPGAAVEIPAPFNSAAQQFGLLSSISCQSNGTCVAVGEYAHDSGHTEAMVVPFTNGVAGAAYAAGSVPANSDPAQNRWLDEVACPASGTCSAMGGYVEASTGKDRTMVMPITAGVAGQGTEQLPPADSTDSEITEDQGMSCQPSGDCVAVGDYEISGSSTAAVAIPIKNGVPTGADEIQLPADAPSTPAARLDGVACPAAGTCMAGGRYMDRDGVFHAMTVSFDAGAVDSSVLASIPADPSSSQPFSKLATVGCASTSCVLVGSYSRVTDNLDMPFVLSAQAPLTIAPTSLPSGAVGTVYSQALSVAGAWGAYGSWSLQSGSLPADLSLNAQSGVISGTPSVASTSTFTVQLSSTTGAPLQTASQSYSVSIAAAPPSPPAPPAPPVVVAASPKLSLDTHTATVRANRFGLRLSCANAACAGTAKLRITQVVTVKHGKKKKHKRVTVVIGSASFSLAAGQAKTLTLTLNAAGRRALGRSHHLSVTVLDTMSGVKRTLGHLILKPAPVKHKKKH
jgi:hypothetical protein